MATIEWTNDLSVGIGLIDGQHKMLLKHLNDFAAAVSSHQGPVAISSTLDFLINYTNFHFEEEEKHMTWTKFPGLDAQKREHEEFRKTLANMEAVFKEDGATHELAEDMDNLLVNWLLKHIRGVDMEFGKFLREKGVSINDAE
ncbi:MAG TPA: bacteriohemerythrin [Candidatus Hydrogenedentes bacterium]|nr:bacteriohemerythrin [Candidatus Hydrogenedentota bacterium]